MMEKNYYKILEIAKGASDDEIKKAYRKMALKFHPDKNKDPEAESIFKDVAEAYDVLSGSNKKVIYSNVPRRRFPFTFRVDPKRMFSQKFDGNRKFAKFTYVFPNGPNVPQGPNVQRPHAIVSDTHDCFVSLENLLFGSTKKMQIKKQIVSPDGISRTEVKVLTISVKPGWNSGTKVTFAGEGAQMPGRVPADITFIINQKAHPLFRRDGSNLHYTHKLSLRDALCGAVIKVPTLEATTVSLKLVGVINFTAVQRIPGKGMPNLEQRGKRGDLIVNFDIQFPDSLSPAVKKLIQNVLPPI